MRKLNATLLSGENKEEAILKIKDESFAINTNEQMIKIPYSNVKGYNYDEQNEVLSIVKFGGNPIELNIVKDKQLLELLNSITSQNKSNSNESIPYYENNSVKENERELERNATIRDTDSKKTEIRQTDEKKKESKNSDGVIGLIVVVIIIGAIFFGVKSLFFNEPKGLKGDILGIYTIANTDIAVMKIKETTIVAPNNEEKILWEIKDIQKKGDNDYNFSMYDGDTKKYECTSTFGMITCNTSNGEIIIFTKKQ